MEPSPLTLWLWTVGCVAGLAAGLVAHLRLHPLRSVFSDACEFLYLHSWLVGISGASILLVTVWGVPPMLPGEGVHDLWNWRDCAGPLIMDVALKTAILWHDAIPAWPLCLVLPLGFTYLLKRITARPYQYGDRKLSLIEQRILLVLTSFAWIWLLLEIVAASGGVSVITEVLRQTGRLLYSALGAAVFQVWLVRLAIRWEEPVEPSAARDATEALDQTLRRWRECLALSVFNLLWMTWLTFRPDVATRPVGWVLLEVLLFFAPLPVAIGRFRGSWLGYGAACMTALYRAGLHLLGVFVTSVALLLLIVYASGIFMDVLGDGWGRMIVVPLHALAVATLRIWLLLAAVLTLLRHGFRTSLSTSSPP